MPTPTGTAAGLHWPDYADSRMAGICRSVTPGNDARWSEVLGEVCELVGAAEGAYLLINADDLQTEGFALSGYSDEHVRRYAGYGGAAADVRYKYIDRLVPGRVFREFEYVPNRSEYDASESALRNPANPHYV